MSGTKQIMISHVCSTDKSESEEILADKTVLQVCSTDEGKSKTVIVYKYSTEESNS